MNHPSSLEITKLASYCLPHTIYIFTLTPITTFQYSLNKYLPTCYTSPLQPLQPELLNLRILHIEDEVISFHPRLHPITYNSNITKRVDYSNMVAFSKLDKLLLLLASF